MNHDQDWQRIQIQALDLREAVADAIRAGDPVSVHTYGHSQDLPEGAEAAHFPAAGIAWISVAGRSSQHDVPATWNGCSLSAVALLVEDPT